MLKSTPKLLVGIVSLVSLFLVTSCKQKPSAEATKAFESIIPKPVAATADGGVFLLTKEATISVDAGNAEAKAVAAYLTEKLKPATGFDLKVEEGNKDASIQLTVNNNPANGSEGYTLQISDKQITLLANKAAGLFNGVQTLRQLFSDKIEMASVQTGAWEIATGTIQDSPSYAWRGSMLDVARHFFGVDDVKRYIDLISYYKINILHLHLSDDQGWRIEIKSWPNLTIHGGRTQVGGGKGGFYTQDQYKEIVAYAASRYITIIPEIDLPGHINAALASYGELNGGTIVPEEGRYVDAATSGILDGKNKPTELYKGTEVGWSTLRVEKEASFKFVGDVMKELAAITPGPYLHIGGDEAHVTKKPDYITFINRFKEIVKGTGKIMIGWEEIAQAEIDSSVVAQYWSKEKYAKLAFEKNAKIVMSPSKRVYLDMQYDSTSRIGLHWAAYIEADAAYNWDPTTILTEVDKKQILGVEAPLWGETIVTIDDIEYLLFPRISGIAEVGWTSVTARSWDSYKVRAAQHGKRWKNMGIDFYRSPKIPWVD